MNKKPSAVIRGKAISKCSLNIIIYLIPCFNSHNNNNPFDAWLKLQFEFNGPLNI